MISAKLAAFGRASKHLFGQKWIVGAVAPAVLLGGMALPALAATYYFIFDVHPQSGSATYFEGVAVINTTDTTLNGTYYFSEIQPVRGQIFGDAATFYSATNVGIGNIVGANFSQSAGTYNALNNQTGSGQGQVANALGSIVCSSGSCYLRDAAFGYTVNGSTYYWIEGTRTSASAAGLDLHASVVPSGTFPYTPPSEGYLNTTSQDQLDGNVKSDCGTTLSSISSTSCAVLTSDPLPEINGAALPKALVLLGSLFLVMRRRLSAAAG